MKKMTALLLALVLTCLFATSAMAVTVTGPKKTFTVGNGIKSDESDEPYLEITEFSTSGAGYFVFWVTNNSNDTQVSPAYYPNSAGVKTIYYMQESRKAGYVKANVSYSARARTNSSVPTNAQSTLVAVFAP